MLNKCSSAFASTLGLFFSAYNAVFLYLSVIKAFEYVPVTSPSELIKTSKSSANSLSVL